MPHASQAPRTEIQPHSPITIPSGPLLQRASLKLLTVSADRRFFEVKRTHLPQNPNMIDTDHNQDELK